MFRDPWSAIPRLALANLGLEETEKQTDRHRPVAMGREGSRGYDLGVTPRPESPSVRSATAADGPAITRLLVRAFEDDPVANFMFAGGRRRERGLHSFFTSQP